MSALPPAETMLSDLRSQGISQCASCFKPPPTAYLVICSVTQYTFAYADTTISGSTAKNETQNMGRSMQLKILFHLG